MHKINCLLLLSTLVFAGSCIVDKEEYIREIDYEHFRKTTSRPGLTEAKFQKIWRVYQDSIEKATLRKRIPPISIADTTGDSLNLQSLITDTSIIYIAGAHCSFGLTGFTNDIPVIHEKFQSRNINIDVICLLRRSEDDQRFPGQFRAVREELQKHYKKFWMIGNDQALRLNVWGSKTFLCDENGKVFYTFTGISTQGPDDMFRRLWKAYTD